MINPEHLYPNKDHFEIRKMPIPESIEGLEDQPPYHPMKASPNTSLKKQIPISQCRKTGMGH